MWRLFMFGFLSMSPGVFSCEIELSPPSVVVSYGGSFVVNCSASFCESITSVGWESPLGGEGLVKGVSSLNLTVNKINLWDLSPQCFINVKQEQLTKDLLVTVYQKPKKVTLVDVGEMEEGQKYMIHCKVDEFAPARNASLFWKIGNESLGPFSFSDASTGLVSESLYHELKPVRKLNGKEIWCEVKLDLWPDGQGPPPVRSESRIMSVLYPPALLHAGNETVEVSSEESLELNCSAIGNPAPHYKWLLPEDLENVAHHTNQSILDLSTHPDGRYICTASNSQGSVTKHFTVVETRDRTTFIAIVTSLVAVGVLLAIGGLYFLKQDGTFACSGKGSSGVL